MIDDDAFRELAERYGRELHVHCYRILGSVQDAEDVLQETLLAAWRGLDGFEGRSSARAWLYRIATNRCLNALRDRARRPREVPALVGAPEPTRRTEPVWVEPYPDGLLEDVPDGSPGPAARYEARETMELAFIVAVQRLPPRQRTAFVLRDVFGFRTAEVADMLDSGKAAVKGALQRARAGVEARRAADRDRARRPESTRQRQLVARFADAVESGDVDDIVALLTDDALLTMRDAPLRVVPIRTNTQPAFGCWDRRRGTSLDQVAFGERRDRRGAQQDHPAGHDQQCDCRGECLEPVVDLLHAGRCAL
jgi:RNA polymerase sigma-70 factor (TIGR02960 family)